MIGTHTPQAPVRTMSSATGRGVTNVTVKNPTGRPVDLTLHLAGCRGVFDLSDKHRRITLAPNASLTVPVAFRTEKTLRMMTTRSSHQSQLQVYDRQGMNLVASVPVTALGPAFLPADARPCYHSPSDSPRQGGGRHNSPPSITRTMLRRGTSLVANMGEIDSSRLIEHIESPGDWVQFLGVVADPGGGATASGPHYRYPEALDYCEASGTFTATHTCGYLITAHNAEGTVRDIEYCYARLPVGFHNAGIPHDRTVPGSHAHLVRSYLENIEDWLRDDGLVRVPDYIRYWNDNVSADSEASCSDRTFSEGGCLFNDSFDDQPYLSAAVGNGGLADDLLTGMRNVRIYTKPSHLPRGFRPDEYYDEENSRLCDPVHGITYGLSTRAAGSCADWIAICLEDGANDMTLMHELFHYAARENYASEERALLISYLYVASRYGWVIDSEWPPF